MSSLQKFHRRTQSLGPASPFTTIGSGNDTVGYWIGDDSSNRLIVVPKSADAQKAWGSYGALRGTTSTTNGLANTNTLWGLGNAAHPAAYYCRTLTTGGYNTWYLPAKDELITCWSNHLATPFSTSNSFTTYYTWSSTETTGKYAWGINFANGGQYTTIGKNVASVSTRAVRRSNI